MLEGFYARTELEVFESKTVSSVPKCGACGLFKGCNSPKMPPKGNDESGILVVGEAPGETEDYRNEPFVGKAGRELRRHVAAVGHDLFEEALVTNSIICRPQNNVTPSEKQIGFCRPNVFNLIKKYRPKVIILLGGPAIRSVIGHIWKSKIGNVERWVGFRIPSQELNAWIVPTWHPSFVMREESPVLDLLFRRHLRSAFRIKRRPWKQAPDYASRVQCFTDGDRAYEPLRQLLSDSGRRIAIDYETNCKKPDSRRSQIISCALSDGKQCVSFMWNGKAVKLVGDWLKSDAPKIAANKGFEERWTRKEFGYGIGGVCDDVNIQMHVIDNRPLITGVKFQAFVTLGLGPYDRHVAPYLKAKEQGGYKENTIRKCPIKDLLLYGGIDAVVEALLYKAHDRRLK